MHTKDHSRNVPDIWKETIKRYLLSRKKLHVLSYQDISKRLASNEINQSPHNLSAKYNKGRLSASLMISSLIAMGEKAIDLQELQAIMDELRMETKGNR